MAALAALILTVALSAYWGFINANPLYTALLAIAGGVQNVLAAGWHTSDGGPFMSLLWALIFSFSVCTLAHVVGYSISRLVAF
jgi:hypothetical protein